MVPLEPSRSRSHFSPLLDVNGRNSAGNGASVLYQAGRVRLMMHDGKRKIQLFWEGKSE